MRGMWIQEREWTREETQSNKVFQEGFYLFGGIDSDGIVHNDLWLVRPYYFLNNKYISKHTFDYIA